MAELCAKEREDRANLLPAAIAGERFWELGSLLMISPPRQDGK